MDHMSLTIWVSIEQKKALRKAFAEQMQNPPQACIDCVNSFPRGALPGTMITALMSTFASLDEGSISVHTSGKPYYLNNLERVDAAIIRLIAKEAVSIALVHCHKRGIDFTPAHPDSSFLGNLLRMMGKPDPDGKIEGTLERLWVLYADHEMTNSTAAFLHAASTLTDPLSCSVAGIISAYGPLHGGAIDLAYRAFEEVGEVGNVPQLIAKVKAKKQRLFGYGHRVYKTVDPRSKYILQMIDENMERFQADPLLRVALEIDRVARVDPYFTSRKLRANADLYGCLMYTALGFETDIILGLACLSRTPGVMAHWREAMQQAPRLWRPQQVFVA
jgi:citrate synthase